MQEAVHRPVYDVNSDSVSDLVELTDLDYAVPLQSSSDSSPRDRRRSFINRTGTLFENGGLAFNRTIGYRIRKVIYKIEDTIGPIVKKLIPNFMVAHYVYILTWIILGSVVIYGNKNLKYIDSLFFASGAATQAGLNTIDLNEIKLYQQITIYVISMFTTPIFIHGSLVFLRLYWFEKVFDDIKEKSVQQFKNRRTMTLARLRTETMAGNDNERLNGSELISDRFNDQRNNLHNNNRSVSPFLNSDGEVNHILNHTSLATHFKEPSYDSEINSNVHNIHQNEEDNEEEEGHYSDDHNNHKEISSGEDSDTPINEQSHIKFDTPKEQHNIKFADLPKPSKARHTSPVEKKRRTRDINPRDLLMSISVLQQQPENEKEHIDSGPALKIKGPLELERENKVPGYKERKRLLKERKKLKKQKKQEDNLLHIPLQHHQFSSFKHENVLSDENGNGESSENDENFSDMSSADVKHLSSSHPLDKITSNFEHAIHRGKRRASFFARTLTGRRDDDNDEEDEDDDDDDDELISGFSGELKNTNYLSWTPTVGRNSNFVIFSEDQKKELGGVEYQSMKLLSWILIFYYVGFHTLAMVFFLPFITTNHHYNDEMKSYGFSPTWWGFFTPQSVFNDLGYTLTPNSMIPFQQNAYIAIVSSFFIVIGNTGFPVFLRLIIWILHKFSKPLTMFRDSLTFLLLHPRRCFTLLFPSGPTWWLFTVLLILNLIDWILFIILDFNSKELSSLPKGYRVLDGLFQSFSTRTAGFAIVDLSTLNPAIKVSYTVMMYISVLPLAISIRRTNVYEEQSLGVYENDDDEEAEEEEDHKKEQQRLKFIGSHLRRQLSFDLWFLFLAIFIVCICESKRITQGDFTIFDIMFELTSAYGTVGLSLGFPGSNTSLCGEFTVLAKLVVIATMIRGRHRGLPNSIDRAILLNEDKMKMRDNVQSYTTMKRNQTANTVGSRMSENSGWKQTGHRILKFVGQNLFTVSGDTRPPKRTLTREASRFTM